MINHHIRDLERFATRERFTKHDERDLHRRAVAGDRSARDRLIRAVLPMVIAIASRRCPPRRDLENVIAEGNAALFEAVEKFNPDRGAWTTCAYWHVQKAVLLALKTDRLIRVPVEWLRTNLQHAAPGHETHAAMQPVQSVHFSIRDGERPRELAIEPDHAADVDEADSRAKLNATMHAAVERLPLRDRWIVLGRNAGQSLLSLAEELGISKERVRQLEQRAMGRLKRALTAGG